MSFKFVRVLVACAVAGAMFCLPAAAATKGHVHFLAGQFTLNDEDDTEPLEDLTQFGVELSIAGEDWPIMLAVDVLFANGDESESYSYAGYSAKVDIELTLTEVAVGVKKIWGENKVHPFVAGGVGHVQADVEFDVSVSGGGGSLSFDVDGDESGTGLWGQGGVFWQIGNRFEIGGQVRYNTVEVDVESEDIQIGGLEYGVILGWGWP